MASLFRTVSVVLLALAVLGAVAFFAWARRLEHRSLYRPHRTVVATPADARLRWQPVTFLSDDGKTSLEGWWIPSPGARLTVLYCHGYSGNIGDLVGTARAFHDLGCNLLLWDYRGYGRSDGRPGERGIRQDAIAAYDAAARLAPGAGVVVYGISLGAAVAVRLADDLRGLPALPPPRALVAESGFSSVADMARRLHPWAPAWLVRGHYPSDEAAARLAGLPKLFLHARDDAVVPWESGRALFAAAAEPKRFATLTGPHAQSDWAALPALRKFLAEAAAAAPEEPAAEEAEND
ncbi:MAG: alpha/beta hydrolase [Kiritimatiellae bacterium]|nr:alpha/beta hydrolase [Kiritimatiellia bacterium]